MKYFLSYYDREQNVLHLHVNKTLKQSSATYNLQALDHLYVSQRKYIVFKVCQVGEILANAHFLN